MHAAKLREQLNSQKTAGSQTQQCEICGLPTAGEKSKLCSLCQTYQPVLPMSYAPIVSVYTRSVMQMYSVFSVCEIVGTSKSSCSCSAAGSLRSINISER